MDLLNIIQSTQNWEEVLSNKPYSLSIKRDGEYILFSYNMIESDFSLTAVREARGIIFRESTWTVVCYPFEKFFNVQEGNAAPIDWDTAVVQEKLDGSIIKVWYDADKWHVSTNGTIDAANAQLMTPADLGVMQALTYYDLFVYAAGVAGLRLEKLNPSYTYMFELVSPFNRIVVPYTETKIYHIGSRDNKTFEEMDLYIGIDQPREYPLGSLEECLQSASELPFSEEGYVVRDANFNRVKIKSAAYVAAHHLKNNGVVTMERILDLIRVNGHDDFISIYPEYGHIVDRVLNGIDWFLSSVNNDWEAMPDFSGADRKTYALWARNQHAPAFFFALLDGRVENVEDWFWSQNNEKILKEILP